MSNKPGRNEPCPCGSGKKYKRCCGAPGAAATASSDADMAAPDGAVANVVQYVSRDAWKANIIAATEAYLAPQPNVDVTNLYQTLSVHPELGEIFSLHFHEWLLSDYEDSNGDNPLDEYLQRRGWRESARGREWLESLREHRMSLYEVRDIVPGEQMTLYDRLRGGDPVTVVEHTSTLDLSQWDNIVTRVVPLRGTNLLSGSGLHFPRDLADGTVQHLSDDRNQYDNWGDCLRDAGPTFMAAYMQRFTNPLPMPELRTSDGDSFCFSKQTFTFPAELKPQVEAALDAHGLFHADHNGAYIWTERAEGENDDFGRLLGNVELGDDTGTLQTQSKARLDNGTELLQSILPDAVEFSFPVYEDPWQAAKNAPAHDAPATPDIPANEMGDIIQQVLDRQYANWCDEPIPALDNETPREAARSNAGRHAVIELLKDYENNDARKPPEQRYDFGWMWDELNLDRDAAIDEDSMRERHAMIMDVVEAQMEENAPPAVRTAYDRLTADGHEHDDAMNLIGCALVDQIYTIAQKEQSFDEKSYTAALNRLPTLPWE